MKHKTRSFALSRRAALGGLAALTASALALPAFAAEPLNVVATTGMIADVARQIGGDAVTVKALMGPGVDPHSYRQTRSDIVSMTRADVVLWHGLYLEAQMEEFFFNLAHQRPVFAVAEALPKDVLLSNADYEDRFDPHVWMAPELFIGVVIEVGRVLGEARPEMAEAFAANALAYADRLRALDSYARETLEQVPQEQRVLLTAHDAFSYFGRAYGFEVMGIQGISTESEAGLNRISALVDTIVTRGLGAVFVETSVSDRNMRALVEGAEARGHQVRIGGELFSDAMGQDGTYEGTYIGMIDHNVTTIARALGVEVPAGGMSGQLNQGS
ncbi:metal ABC transporter solute-binding protein, Zn/Mn family [Pseudosulfitobacter koreensis]|uniref:Zinc ABC transporter substrate-binding protein n=1 Tax=Pseudosulfitobacter koreensis TaxID=2968472 RepID=A0ABT1Z1A4_9RHOB|nr:zinc ABC transporter substrate-binding protein [Pseudosulfitobacter koreense]MCR8826906.1 zinc ABC transporter substrate-binding protein [Pseudosulfitobacter koreense]